MFGQSTKIIKSGTRGRLLHFSKNVLLGQDETLQELVSKLDKLCQGEHRLVSAETLMEVKRTGHTVDGVDMALTETKTMVEDTNVQMNQVSSSIQNLTIEQQEFRNDFRKEVRSVMTAFEPSGADVKGGRAVERIKAILEPSVSPLDTYQSIAKRRVPGTGDWVRGEQLFRTWMERSTTQCYGYLESQEMARVLSHRTSCRSCRSSNPKT